VAGRGVELKINLAFRTVCVIICNENQTAMRTLQIANTPGKLPSVGEKRAKTPPSGNEMFRQMTMEEYHAKLISADSRRQLQNRLFCGRANSCHFTVFDTRQDPVKLREIAVKAEA
jgi:hypothetical protein